MLNLSIFAVFVLDAFQERKILYHNDVKKSIEVSKKTDI